MEKRYLLMLILLIGCSPTLKTKTVSLNNPELNFTSTYSDTENNVPNYNCDDFANNALNIYSLDYLKTNFSENRNYTITPVNNLHDKNVVDTLYQFSENNNLIEYYDGAYGKFVTKFEVTSSKYELYGGISVGNSKDGFKKKFSIQEEIGDIVNIGNTNKTAVYTFYFNDNKIHKIRSFLYFD